MTETPDQALIRARNSIIQRRAINDRNFVAGIVSLFGQYAIILLFQLAIAAVLLSPFGFIARLDNESIMGITIFLTWSVFAASVQIWLASGFFSPAIHSIIKLDGTIGGNVSYMRWDDGAALLNAHFNVILSDLRRIGRLFDA